jgi:hypothetical protein
MNACSELRRQLANDQIRRLYPTVEFAARAPGYSEKRSSFQGSASLL